MRKVAGNKRMVVVAWAAVAALLLAVAFTSLSAYGVEGASSGSSEPSSTTASSAAAGASASSATEDAASAADEAAAEPGNETSAEASEAAAQVQAALEREVVPEARELAAVDGVAPDTGGSAFTFVTPLASTDIPGDLYWLGNELKLAGSRVGNDVMAAAFQLAFSYSQVNGDVRMAGQSAALAGAVVRGNADIMALEISVDGDSAANGFYCGGGTIRFDGAAKRFIAYGTTIYFNGVVDGDVTLSAQDIVIGPEAKVTGLLDIRSGQNLDALRIPATAQIARIDTNLDHPNTIDQITQLRAAIAPYFQIGSMLFVVVSFILMGLAALWGFQHKMTEANRLVRRYPLAVLVLGCIALMLMFVAVMLGTVLIFTIPLSLLVGFILLAFAIFCVPFTGSSLALMLRHRIKPAICVVLGSGLGGALLFVPNVNVVVFAASLIYFTGYAVNIAMFGHDERHDASFHARQADEDAPGGKARGILPVSVGEEPDTPTPEDAAKAADIGPFADAHAGVSGDAEDGAGEGSDGLGEDDADAPVDSVATAADPSDAPEGGSGVEPASEEDAVDRQEAVPADVPAEEPGDADDGR